MELKKINISSENNEINIDLNGIWIGKLSDLKTSAKSDVVSAINEIKTYLNSLNMDGLHSDEIDYIRKEIETNTKNISKLLSYANEVDDVLSKINLYIKIVKEIEDKINAISQQIEEIDAPVSVAIGKSNGYILVNGKEIKVYDDQKIKDDISKLNDELENLKTDNVKPFSSRIKWITQEEYSELQFNDQLDPQIEYHIVDRPTAYSLQLVGEELQLKINGNTVASCNVSTLINP